MNDTHLDYDEYYLSKLEEIQDHSFVLTVGLVVLFVYGLALVFGVPGNIYVLYRLLKLAREDEEKYKNGTGSGLFAMATADVLSLLSISLHNCFSGISIDINHWISTFFCKILVFTTHTATSVSIWSWLLMSTLRYLAIRHPLFHLRLWRAPKRAITLIIFMSSVTNLWLLFAVDYTHSSCAQLPLNNDGSLNRWMHLIECLWSFCLPVAAIIYMDAMVIICPRFEFRGKHEATLTRNATVRCKARATLWKWLTIAFIDVLLNAPENLYRLIMLCGIISAEIPDVYNFSARMVAQALYFTQFAFNAVYLALFIYDNNIRRRSAKSASNRFFSSAETSRTSKWERRSLTAHRQRRERLCQSQKEARQMTIAKLHRRSLTETDLTTLDNMIQNATVQMECKKLQF